ncbi:DUF74-domain-containing protein [Rhizoclosmatium globosum]|uniref:DUF74-domain-containing protein n=1 Tax=Rhizoclosmatium globosum TaxID=329046 RepID=A0A1Y2CL13_9FUNG|nr:DUF74-domain-containing protein [Rhizoclosmatium globosum]|eukprot:ORY47005.1 DUF74-domain-containing protein [Rhizoclosmatium globosum]
MDFKKIERSDAIPFAFVSTIPFAPAGYKITQQLGMVRGLTVRSRNLVTAFGADLKSLVGGVNLTYKKQSEDTRMEAYNFMVEEAASLGANCVIGVQYNEEQLGTGGTSLSEVLCYGTAVRVEVSKEF